MAILKYVDYASIPNAPVSLCFFFFEVLPFYVLLAWLFPTAQKLSLLACCPLGVCPVSFPCTNIVSCFWSFRLKIQVNQVYWSCMYNMSAYILLPRISLLSKVTNFRVLVFLGPNFGYTKPFKLRCYMISLLWFCFKLRFPDKYPLNSWGIKVMK